MKLKVLLAVIVACSINLNAQVINDFPYFNGFEEISSDWIATGDWERGNPSKVYLDDANNGLSCWTTKLVGSYSSSSTHELVTPFFDLSNLDVPYISFQINHRTNSSNDNLRLEYSTNGISWQYVPYGNLKYMNYRSNWSYSSYGYDKVINSLENIPTTVPVKFRFLFSSGSSSNQSEGFCIDDFVIGNFPSSSQNDFEAIFLGEDKGGICSGVSPVAFLVQNNSSSRVFRSNYTISMEYSNGAIVNESVSNSYFYGNDYFYHVFNGNPPAGIVKAWVSYSLDNNRRNDTLSFVKATLNLRDVGVTSIVSPESNLGCDTNSFFVTSLVANYGTRAVSNISMNYQVNGGAVINEILSSSLASYCINGAQRQHTFTTPVVFPNDGIYRLKVWTSDSADTDPSNDTVTTIVNYSSVKTLPYFEDFEMATPAVTGSVSGSVLPPGWAVSGNSSWLIRTGSSTNNTTGVSSGYGGQGNYLYQSNSFYDQITSPCIQIPNTTNRISLDFFAHSWSSFGYSNSLRMNVRSLTSFRSQMYYVVNLTQQSKEDAYDKLKYSLDYFKGETIVIDFYVQGGFYSSSAAIDNIAIYESDSIDIELNAVYQPLRSNLGCGPTEESRIKISLGNLGLNTVDSLSVCYQVNSESPVCESLTGGVLYASQSIDFTFDQLSDFTQPGDYFIKCYVQLDDDKVNLNDTVKSFFQNRNLGLPYMDKLDDAGSVGYLSKWKSSGLFDYSWNLWSGPTQQFNTGPNSDADGNQNGLYYFSAVNSNASEGQTAILELSNCFNSAKGSSIGVDFDYHMYGSTIGSLKLAAITSGGIIVLDSIKGQQQTSSMDAWKHRRVYWDSLPDDQVKFLFVATNGDGTQSNIAIDNFLVSDTATSISEINNSASLEVLVYPNPSKNYVIIEISDENVFKGKLSVNVIGLDGKVVIEERLINNRARLNTGMLSNGFYILKIESGGKLAHSKFQVNR